MIIKTNKTIKREILHTYINIGVFLPVSMPYIFYFMAPVSLKKLLFLPVHVCIDSHVILQKDFSMQLCFWCNRKIPSKYNVEIVILSFSTQKISNHGLCSSPNNTRPCFLYGLSVDFQDLQS